MTFEQPFRLPRAEEAQGVLHDLNPQLNKAQLAISRPAFSPFFCKDHFHLQLRKHINRGQHFFVGTVALMRRLEVHFNKSTL